MCFSSDFSVIIRPRIVSPLRSFKTSAETAGVNRTRAATAAAARTYRAARVRVLEVGFIGTSGLPGSFLDEVPAKPHGLDLPLAVGQRRAAIRDRDQRHPRLVVLHGARREPRRHRKRLLRRRAVHERRRTFVWLRA